jgi:hypothetical protein
MMPLYLVETVSIFRHRYVVEAKEEDHAADEVVYNMTDSDFKEFSQHHVDECITSIRQIKDEEFEPLFDKDNDYLKDWTLQSKRDKFINVIEYDS